jgi:hypothetical protein
VVDVLLISDRSAELFSRDEFRNVVVGLCKENVVFCFGKLYLILNSRVLRFLVVLLIYLFSVLPAIRLTKGISRYMYIDIDIVNMAYSILQGLFLIDLRVLKVFPASNNIFCGCVIA